MPESSPTTKPASGPTDKLEPTWGDTLSCLWTGWSCWFMAWLFYTAWRWPLKLEDGQWVRLGVGVMLLEFILVHSGGIMHHLMETKGGWDRIKSGLLFAGFYAIFALGFALGFKSWWLFGSYAMVMGGRLWGLVSGPWTPMDQAITRRRMVASVSLYLGLIFTTSFLPVPRGGLTPALVNRVMSGTGSGAWVDHPEKALAMGTFYFLLLGLIEMRPPRRMLQA